MKFFSGNSHLNVGLSCEALHVCELKIKAFCVILPNAFYATKNLVPNLGHFAIVWMIPSVRRWLKNAQNFGKNRPNSPRAKNAKIIYIKAQFESLKHLHQTTLEFYLET